MSTFPRTFTRRISGRPWRAGGAPAATGGHSERTWQGRWQRARGARRTRHEPCDASAWRPIMEETLALDPTPLAGDRAKGSITFVGTATVILRHAGFTILTDPNFLHQGDHVHLGFGLTSERLTEPGVAFEDLPAIDFVLLSHLHEDHFDRTVAERLDKKTPIVTTPHAARGLARKGFERLFALETWGSLLVTRGAERVHVVAMPGKHAPLPLQPFFPSVMGTLLDFSTGLRLYVTGDTLLHDKLKEIPQRFPGIDIAL